MRLDHFHVECPWRFLRRASIPVSDEKNSGADDEDAEEVCAEDTADLDGKKGSVAGSVRRQRWAVLG